MSEALLAQCAQKLSILREAEPSVVTAVVDVGDAAEQGYGLRQTAAALGLGSLQAGMAQLFVLRTAKGTPHFYGQPFDGRMALPGEHHIVLPFPSPAPASYVDGLAGGDWKSPSAAFQAALRKHPISELMRRADFEWRLGAGVAKRDCLAQLRPTANGQTHLVMKATGEHGVALDTRPVGFSTYTQLVLALMQAPPAGTGSGAAAPAAANFLTNAIFMSAFGELQSSGPPPAIPRANLAGRDLGPAIHQLLSAHAKNKLSVSPLPPKKEANARNDAMPRDARGLPVVALVDLTLMGSASNAIVITPSHLFYRHDDDRLQFDWAEVRAVAPPADALAGYIRFFLAERGWMAIRCGDHAPALAALFDQFAQLPG